MTFVYVLEILVCPKGSARNVSRDYGGFFVSSYHSVLVFARRSIYHSCPRFFVISTESAVCVWQVLAIDL